MEDDCANTFSVAVDEARVFGDEKKRSFEAAGHEFVKAQIFGEADSRIAAGFVERRVQALPETVFIWGDN